MQGRVVIVTGGAKGIGRHAAHTLAKAGAKVVLADADAERLHKTLGEIQQLGAEALAVPTDVRDEKDVRQLVYKVADRFGQIDALINDAGIVPHFNWGIPRWPRVRNLSYDFWNAVIQTNLGGTFLCSKYVLPFMEERRSGNIVNLWGGGRPENHGASPLRRQQRRHPHLHQIHRRRRARMECLRRRLQPEASDRHGRRARRSAPAPARS